MILKCVSKCTLGGTDKELREAELGKEELRDIHQPGEALTVLSVVWNGAKSGVHIPVCDSL